MGNFCDTRDGRDVGRCRGCWSVWVTFVMLRVMVMWLVCVGNFCDGGVIVMWVVVDVVGLYG